jgi:YHS domain-containing protein
MDVDISKPAGKRVYKGKTYYFCSDYCVKRFDSHPEEYVAETGKK